MARVAKTERRRAKSPALASLGFTSPESLTTQIAPHSAGIFTVTSSLITTQASGLSYCSKPRQSLRQPRPPHAHLGCLGSYKSTLSNQLIQLAALRTFSC